MERQWIRRGISFLLVVILVGILGCSGQEKRVFATEEKQGDAVKEKQVNMEEDMKLAGQDLVSPSVCGRLQVKGTKLCDRYGNPIQLRGISTHGIAWFPDYINEFCFSEFRQNWNVNVIRLAMYTAEYGGYCFGGDKDALKELVRKGVEYAVKQDLYVVIDWHVLSDGNPAVYQEEAKKFFAEMAEEYADCPNVLYEICNEPNGQTSWADIKAYANEVISVIRSKDKDGVILVGTPNWSQYVDQAAQDPITGYENIMYTLHFYAATHKEALRNTMIEAVNMGLPVFVSEFGICDASGNGGIDFEQAEQWMETMDAYKISYIAWNLSNKEETSAIFKKDCQKKYGFEEGDLSESGKWLYQMFTGRKEVLDVVDSGDHLGDDSAGGKQQGILAENKEDTAKTSEICRLPLAETSAENSKGLDKAEQQKSLDGNNKIVSIQNGDGFSYEMVQYTSWESEGNVFYQYGVKVKNNLGTSCNNWQISIPFNQAVVLQDGWNGNYSVEGAVLTIQAKDYNGQISDGGVVDGIGFIVSGGAGLKPIS